MYVSDREMVREREREREREGGNREIGHHCWHLHTIIEVLSLSVKALMHFSPKRISFDGSRWSSKPRVLLSHLTCPFNFFYLKPFLIR